MMSNCPKCGAQSILIGDRIVYDCESYQYDEHSFHQTYKCLAVCLQRENMELKNKLERITNHV